VSVFDKALFAFNGAPGGVRRQTAPAAFPSAGSFQQIHLQVQLDCPPDGCDVWDRVGSIGIVTQPPVDGGMPGTVVEIARFITPFGVSAPMWDYDLTDLAPLLTGNATVQGFIDTWSPQGNAGQNGAGWLLTAKFVFTAGTPAKLPVANIPVWSWPADVDPPSTAQYGDPADPISAHILPRNVPVSPGASSYALRSFVTGHGQGNSNNCAEFCMSTHTVTVGAQPFSLTPWRTCCTPDPACEGEANPTPAPGVAPGQLGTYPFPRSGWCPGAMVDAWTVDVTQAVGTGPSAAFAYGLDSYVNACRMDAPTCDMTQCELGTGCAYDGMLHTMPFFYVSSLLIAYR
jgi:hypothetical protein